MQHARTLRPSAIVVLGVSALLAAAAVVLLTGAHFRDGDADPLLVWAFALALAAVNGAVAVTLGGLALAAWALDPARPEFPRALDLAAAGAAAWTLVAIVAALLEFAITHPDGLGPDAGTASLVEFVTTDPAGLAWMTTVLAGAVLTAACILVRRRGPLAIALVAGSVSLLPFARQRAVIGYDDLAEYLLFLCASIGAGIIVTRVYLVPSMEDRIAAVLPRTTALAIGAIALATGSGLIAAWHGVGTLDGLQTRYGALVLLVAAAVIGAAALTVAPRSGAVVDTAPRLRIALLGIAIGAAAALSTVSAPGARTLGPLDELSPSEVLTGRSLPAAPTPFDLVLAGTFNPIPLLAGLAAIAAYSGGLRRLWARGDGWPVRRTVAAALAVVVFVWATNGFPSRYGDYLLGAHILLLLVVGLVVPPLLIAAQPIRLLRAAVPARTDGSLGAREWVAGLSRSPAGRLISAPPAIAVLAVVTPWLFAIDPVLRWTVTDPVGCCVALAWLLVVGTLVARLVLGAEGRGIRRTLPVRFGVAAALAASLAAAGAALVLRPGLLLADWYGALGRTWGPTPLAAQAQAGVLIWVVGGTALLVVVAVAVGRRRA